jgi:PAS domain S-box-containing protein
MAPKLFSWKLFAVLALIGLAAVSVSTLVLYSTTIASETANLQALSRSHAKLISSIAQFEEGFNRGYGDGGSRGATLRQITQAHLESNGFGATGEIVIGELVGEEIHFLIDSRVLGGAIPTVDMNAETAEPMRRALLGLSGAMEAPDYLNQQVLAWHEPIPELNAGLVAKIDKTELLIPFERAMMRGSLIALIASLLCCFGMGWVSTRSIAAAAVPAGNRSVVLLGACLTLVGAVSAASVMVSLYSSGVERQKAELLSLSIGMSSLMNAVASFDLRSSGEGDKNGSTVSTVSQVQSAMKVNLGFGKTGEIVLGTLAGDNIEFLLPSRFTGLPSRPVSLQGSSAEPMRRALSGESGEIESLDYRGKRVLAAYQPVVQLQAGVVAKMDLDEIKAPYILNAILNASLTLFIVMLGVLLAPRIFAGTDRSTDGQEFMSVTVEKQQDQSGTQPYLPFLLLALTGFIFLLDYLTPLGVAAGVPYIALIIAGAYVLGERGLVALTVLATGLVFVGWMLAPGDDAALWKVLTNRLYAVFTLWLAAIILLRNKRARESNRRSQERLLAFMESAPEATLIVGQEGDIVFANQQAENMFGYSRSRLMQMNVDALVPDEVRERHPGLRASYIKNSHVRPMGAELNLRARKSRGEAFPVEISLSPVESAEEVLVIVSVRDITERKKMQDAIAAAKEVAEEATQAKSDFLANMSHEIRTPMNAIIGMSDLALKTDLSVKQHNYIDKVNRSAVSLLGIINDILDFSKIEAGKLDLEIIKFELDEVLDNLSNLVGLKAEEKGLELLLDIDTAVPRYLVGDPLRLGQVLVNLCNNAVKFTESGEIVVSVKAQKMQADAVTLNVSVRDTGIGMTEQQQLLLFKAFSQADASITRQYGGTGLGLTICERLVGMMNGDMSVRSEQGKGSTFSFTVRLGWAESPEAAPNAAALDLESLRVLVVDDNPTARTISEDIASSLGFRVDAASGGEQAVAMVEAAIAKTQPYDVVLMDWKMPVMDGVATTQTLVDRGLLSDTQAVMMVTAYGRDEATVAGEGLPIKSFLTKPVNASTLLDAILVAHGRQGVARRQRRQDRDTVESTRQLTGAYVLLVEDNEINQELALELLSSAGMRVDVADNGQLALDKLAVETYDGVLMDIQMPVMDGYTAAREIRKQAHFKDLPVIAMTANAMVGDREKALAAGMNDHIAKPLIVADMFATMATWITPSGQPAAVTASQKPLPGTLAPIAGVDVDRGLAICAGNAALYRKLLLKFVDANAGFEQQFRDAQASEDDEAAMRVAHNLKGVASNMGASALATTAEVLESACRGEESTTVISVKLRELAAVLGPVIEAIRGAGLAAQPLDAEPVAPTTIDLEATLAQLRVMLERSDPKVRTIADEMQKAMQGTPQEETMKALITQIDIYDFDQALVCLAELEAKP